MVRATARPPGRFIPVSEARANFSGLLALVRREGRDATPVFIGRHGEPMAVLISLEQYYDYSCLLDLRRRIPGGPPRR